MTIFSFCDDGKLWDPAKSKDFFFLFFGGSGFEVNKISASSGIEVVDEPEAAANLNFLAFTEELVEVEVVLMFLEVVRLTMLVNPFLTCFVKLVLLSATA